MSVIETQELPIICPFCIAETAWIKIVGTEQADGKPRVGAYINCETCKVLVGSQMLVPIAQDPHRSVIEERTAAMMGKKNE